MFKTEDELQRVNKELQRQVHQLTGDLKGIEETHESKIEHLMEQLSTKDQKLSESLQELGQMQEELTTVRDDIEQAEEAVRVYRDNLQQIEEQN